MTTLSAGATEVKVASCHRRIGEEMNIHIEPGSFDPQSICDFLEARGSEGRDGRPVRVSRLARRIMDREVFDLTEPRKVDAPTSRQVLKVPLKRTGLGCPARYHDISTWAVAQGLGTFKPRTALRVAVGLCVNLTNLEIDEHVLVSMDPVSIDDRPVVFQIAMFGNTRILDVHVANDDAKCGCDCHFVYNLRPAHLAN